MPLNIKDFYRDWLQDIFDREHIGVLVYPMLSVDYPDGSQLLKYKVKIFSDVANFYLFVVAELHIVGAMLKDITFYEPDGTIIPYIEKQKIEEILNKYVKSNYPHSDFFPFVKSR